MDHKTRTWLAKIGKKGGKTNSAAQQAARAANGVKGGRPRKKVLDVGKAA